LMSKPLRVWHIVSVLQQIASWRGCPPYGVISNVSC